MEFRHHPKFADFLLSIIEQGKMEEWLDFQTTHEQREEWFAKWLNSV